MSTYHLSKHIHSNFASFSSGDVFVTKEVSASEFRKTKRTETISYKGNYLGYVEADKTLYHEALHSRLAFRYENKEKLQEIVNEHLKAGWSEKDVPWQKDYWKDQEERRIARRKKEGYLFPDGSHEIKPAAFQGGFSDTVFNHPDLQNYVSGGCVFGYIGHSVRKANIDKIIEKAFFNLPFPIDCDKVLVLATWLSSTDGRHFGDSLEGYKFREQREKIYKYAPQIYNKGYIYSLKAHTGTYESSLKLEQEHASELIHG